MGRESDENTTTDEIILRPQWPAPRHIVAGTSLRTLTKNNYAEGSPYTDGNMAQHVGDCLKRVAKNRHRLATLNTSQLSRWQWLDQQHGNRIATINHISDVPIAADALCTSSANLVCAVLSADCLPILLSDHYGRRIAAIHAGWRGLASGIIDNSITAFCRADSNGKRLPTEEIYAWLGPAIGADHFEVGADVVAAFNASSKENSRYHEAFRGGENGKYYADIYQLARIALSNCGVESIYGGNLCTVCDTQRFFSYRRNNLTGRMASFITIAAEQNNH